MDYDKLIDENLKKAFEISKSLLTRVIFIKKINPEFDFNTKLVNVGSAPQVPADILWTSSKKIKNVIKRKLMVMSENLGDVNFYDKVDDGGIIWGIGETIRSNGYITILEVSRSV
jgi:hypothetical protein